MTVSLFAYHYRICLLLRGFVHQYLMTARIVHAMFTRIFCAKSTPTRQLEPRAVDDGWRDEINDAVNWGQAAMDLTTSWHVVCKKKWGHVLDALLNNATDTYVWTAIFINVQCTRRYNMNEQDAHHIMSEDGRVAAWKSCAPTMTNTRRVATQCPWHHTYTLAHDLDTLLSMHLARMCEA